MKKLIIITLAFLAFSCKKEDISVENNDKTTSFTVNNFKSKSTTYLSYKDPDLHEIVLLPGESFSITYQLKKSENKKEVSYRLSSSKVNNLKFIPTVCPAGQPIIINL